MRENKIKAYHIETLDGTSSLNFTTGAYTNKEALLKLIAHSQDFRNLVKEDNDLTIKIKEIK